MRGFKPSKSLHFLIVLFLILTLISLASCGSKQERDWKKAQQENTISSHEAFLKQYLEGKYANEARSRIEALKEEIHWKKAQQENTISSYQKFLDQYPQSGFADEARSRITLILKEERHPSFRDAKRVRIIINEFYKEAKKVSLAYEITDILSKLLKHTAIDVITEKLSEHDFTIKVNVTGEPLYGFYWVGRLYTGASVEGNIVFEAKDGYKISEKIGGRGDPTTSIIYLEGNYQTPDDAPFESVLIGGGTYHGEVDYQLIKRIGILIHKSFGITPLLSAMKDEDSDVQLAAAYGLSKLKDSRAVEPLIFVLKNMDFYVRYDAAKALGNIKDPRAVEPLIEVLEDNDSDVQKYAAKALKNITGKDFGKDRKKWQNWWQENKEKYLE